MITTTATDGTFGGSTAFFALALLTILVLVLLLLRYYLPLRTTPLYLLFPVFLALFLPCSIILLVPIDIASNAAPSSSDARGIRLPDAALLVIWRVAYWLTFVLTWFILPLLGEYSDAGYRDPQARLLYAVRSNVRYQLTVLSLGIVGIVYFWISNGVTLGSIKGLVVSLAYAWGSILAIYLMGHGLVSIPRRLWRTASVSARLRSLQAAAPALHDKMTQAELDLDDLEATVRDLRRTKRHPALQDWLDELAESSDIPASRARAEPTAAPAVLTERYLADLTRKLRRARHKRIRFVEEWDTLSRAAAHAQAVLDASGSGRLGTHSTDSASAARARYHFHAHVLPWGRYASSLLLGALSASLVWSEVINPIYPPASVLRYTVVHHSAGGRVGFAGQVIAGLWLCYMCAAALHSIKSVPIWGNRALVRRHTYAESAAWYASQVAKLTVPLSFNFVTMLPREVGHETAFYRFLGRLISMTGLSIAFDRYFQIFILVPVAAAAFGLYGRAERVLGFGVMEEEDEGGFGGWREGRALLDRDRLDRGAGLALGINGAAGDRLAGERAGLVDRAATADRAVGADAGAGRIARQESTLLPRPTPSTVPRRPVLDEEQDEGPFAAFAHRVRNTFEGSSDNRPAFEFNFSRPKWLGGGGSGGDQTGGMAGGETSGRADIGGTLGRLFGGRPDDGRVRL